MILNKKRKLISGFTLVELMIATSLFTIIMLMGVGTLIISSNASRNAQKLRVAVDNVNFAMESMTRELRTGSHFYCSESTVPMVDGLVKDCVSGNVIAFTPQEVDGQPKTRAAYVLQKRSDGTNTLKRCEGDDSNCSDIVSKDVNVETLKFYVEGSYLPDNVVPLPPQTDKIQPSVKVLMSGVVKTKNGSAPFSLQSMAAQRSVEQ